MMWTEAAFSACLAWHWPDHHWSNAIDEWRGRLRARMGAKGGHFEQLCDNIQPYDKRRFCLCQMWHDF